MIKKFHQLAVATAFNAMPTDFKERFLADFSFDLLLEAGDIPYEPECFGEKAELHRGHCLKLYLKGRYLHKIGDSTVLEQLTTFAYGAQQDNPLVVCYNIAKGTHFLIDIGTYPHVNEAIWDKYHTKFEELASTWFEYHQLIISELVQNYKPFPMRSVPNRCRKIADEAYFASIDYLPALKRNGQITDLQWASMVATHCYNLMDWFSTFEKFL
jgi:hypothetical protein